MSLFAVRVTCIAAGVTCLAALLAGCMAAGPQPETLPPRAQPGAGWPSGAPLVLDRADLRLGTTVQYPRIPAPEELYDLSQVSGIAHLLVVLEVWPASYAAIEPLRQLPVEVGLTVLLSGYPPSREAAEAWNLLDIRHRIVLLVDGPPSAPEVIADLNAMRGLERVVAHMDSPWRRGFERLQRPLEFRIVRN
jgi:hypothetical protein